MSSLPIPTGLADTRVTRTANRLHSAAIHLLRRARTADQATGLSPERLSLLSVLCFAGARTVGELATAEMVSAPAISRILNPLAEAGLVRRERATSDRRRVIVHVTAKGRRLMDAARRRRLERIAAELERLDERELGVLEAATEALDSLGRARGQGT